MPRHAEIATTSGASPATTPERWTPPTALWLALSGVGWVIIIGAGWAILQAF